MTDKQMIDTLTAALGWYTRADTWMHRVDPGVSKVPWSSTSPPSRAELDRGDRARLALVAVGVDVEAGGSVLAEAAVKGNQAGATPGGHVGAGAGVPQYIPLSRTNSSLPPNGFSRADS